MTNGGAIPAVSFLLPTKRTPAAIVHQLIDPLGNGLPGLHSVLIPVRCQLRDAQGAMQRGLGLMLFDHLLRAGPYFPVGEQSAALFRHPILLLVPGNIRLPAQFVGDDIGAVGEGVFQRDHKTR